LKDRHRGQKFGSSMCLLHYCTFGTEAAGNAHNRHSSRKK